MGGKSQFLIGYPRLNMHKLSLQLFRIFPESRSRIPAGVSAILPFMGTGALSSIFRARMIFFTMSGRFWGKRVLISSFLFRTAHLEVITRNPSSNSTSTELAHPLAKTLHGWPFLSGNLDFQNQKYISKPATSYLQPEKFIIQQAILSY